MDSMVEKVSQPDDESSVILEGTKNTTKVLTKREKVYMLKRMLLILMRMELLATVLA